MMIRVLADARPSPVEALQWASHAVKGDQEIVLKALSQSWSALKWASDEHRGDGRGIISVCKHHLKISFEFCLTRPKKPARQP